MVVTLLKAVHTTATTPSLSFSEAISYQRDKAAFVSKQPSYSDPSLSSLRKREFSRLDSHGGSVYLDYTGAALYPASLVKNHYQWLKHSVAGNPHSTSPASLHSSKFMDEARQAVLAFFDADEAEYDVVWTSNASGGFKIIGETYDFRQKKVLIPRDAHNSLNSLARKAEAGGGQFEFIEFDGQQQDAISPAAYLAALCGPSLASTSSSANTTATFGGGEKGLIFFTGQSNITGAKLDLTQLLPVAKQHGWDVGLDAAALAPSTRISLREHKGVVDFMVVSLYKICGYPTGLGALILKKEQYAKLTQKPTFFGGNIVGITMDKFDFSLVEGPERFEDGTANFASMAAVKPGLEWAAKWMSKYAHRNRVLLEWLVQQLDQIYYPAEEGEKEEKVRAVHESRNSSSTLGNPSSTGSSSCSTSNSLKKHGRRGTQGTRQRGVKLVRVAGPKDLTVRGFTLPLVFSSADGEALNYRFVIWAAAQQRISLRGGPCMCNPGASSSVMQRGLITDLEASSLLAVADVGIIRVSLGAPTNFKDCWHLIRFAHKLTDKLWVATLWKDYQKLNPGARLSNNIDELQARATRKRT